MNQEIKELKQQLFQLQGYVPCGCCNNGIVTISFRELGKPEAVTTMNCDICDGIGFVSPNMARAIQMEKESWCTCDTERRNIYGHTYHKDTFYRDGTRKQKHHWTCNICKKVTQIG